jgi:hypothetical protein
VTGVVNRKARGKAEGRPNESLEIPLLVSVAWASARMNLRLMTDARTNSGNRSRGGNAAIWTCPYSFAKWTEETLPIGSPRTPIGHRGDHVRFYDGRGSASFDLVHNLEAYVLS